MRFGLGYDDLRTRRPVVSQARYDKGGLVVV